MRTSADVYSEYLHLCSTPARTASALQTANAAYCDLAVSRGLVRGAQ